MILLTGDKFIERSIVSNETHRKFVDICKEANPFHSNSPFAIENGFKELVMCGIYKSVNDVEFKYGFKNMDEIAVANGKMQICSLS